MAYNPAWWNDMIVYQIYPMSFQDANGDGIGDIRGIIQRLDYIQSLGVNMIWLNPIFKSPKVDNGYDVADYRDIDPQFGTLQDAEELLHEAHRRGIRVMFDLVLNHTSDQHPWFQEAIKGNDNPYRDYYLWADGRDGGEKPPNNWQGFFGTSAWKREPYNGQYYMHLFAESMPDLNWENPKVREEMRDIAYFWLEKGVDGFRLDAFIHMAKKEGYPALDLPEGEMGLAEQYYANLPQVKDYLEWFITSVRERFPETYFVGEASSATPELASQYVNKDNTACNSIISFRYFPMDESMKDSRLYGGLQKSRLRIGDFKKTMQRWQEAMPDSILPTLYWNNHDMARVVTRIGDDGQHRENSAKMLAALMYLQRGIPFIMNGEELGMKNLEITQIKDFRAPEAHAFYSKARSLGYDEEWILDQLQQTAKDASRGAMQWDDTEYAGFSTVKPWSGVNIEPHYTVKAEIQNSYSVLNFYKKMLDLKRMYLFIEGDFRLLDTQDEFYVYERNWKGEQAMVVCNMTPDWREFQLPEMEREGYRQMILSNFNVRYENNVVRMGAYGVAVIRTEWDAD